MGGFGSFLSAINPTSVIGSAIAGGADLAAVNLQNAKQKRRDTDAYNRQVALMDMQNAYNMPAAQMQRYIDAGLNPNLIYSQSNLSASPSAVASGSKVSKADFSSPIEGALNRARSKEIAIMSNELARDKLANEIVRTRLERDGLRLQRDKADALNLYRNALLGITKDEVSSKMLTDAKQRALIALQIEHMGYNIQRDRNPFNGAPWYIENLGMPFYRQYEDVYDKSLPALSRNVRR